MGSIRTLVCGDIHGGLKALKQALQRASYDSMRDKLIFLGDYVDGWPESAQLIDYLIELQEFSPKEKPIIFIRGNHDQWCHEWFIYGIAQEMWLKQGGQSTKDSYLETCYLHKDSHKNFFKYLVNYYVDEENRGFVHGGFKSKKGLGHAAHESDYYWDRDMWELAIALNGNIPDKSDPDYNQYYRPNPYRMYKHKEIFIGHSATTMHKIKPEHKEYKDPNQPKNGGIIVPMNRCNVWNLDTGGGWGGKLSIMDIDTKEYWQSDFVKDLYPDHKER